MLPICSGINYFPEVMWLIKAENGQLWVSSHYSSLIFFIMKVVPVPLDQNNSDYRTWPGSHQEAARRRAAGVCYGGPRVHGHTVTIKIPVHFERKWANWVNRMKQYYSLTATFSQFFRVLFIQRCDKIIERVCTNVGYTSENTHVHYIWRLNTASAAACIYKKQLLIENP